MYEDVTGHVASGPSPRARGSLKRVPPVSTATGSIPAGAGKPRRARVTTCCCGVHPRGRGEAWVLAVVRPHVVGPSPRARGSHAVLEDRGGQLGSIPAGAGKPGPGRAGGPGAGVHPRGRGEARYSSCHTASLNGPSPRARGSLDRGRREAVAVRSIPAGAGKPSNEPDPRALARVHPRGRGEAGSWRIPGCRGRGPSPRARGSQPARPPGGPRRGSIPAGAGKPCSRAARAERTRVHPRGRGEAGCRSCHVRCHAGPSPRARGSRPRPRRHPRRPGSIPAGAGKP